jgi:hypothetical protein
MKRINIKSASQNKLTIPIIISMISILIAILSLSFTIYKDMRDYRVDKEIKNLELKSAGFEETYKKISLAEQNLMSKIDSCEYSDELNKGYVNENLELLIEARQAAINNENTKALILLSQLKDVCANEEPVFIDKNLENTFFVSILIGIWIVLVVSLIFIGLKVKR